MPKRVKRKALKQDHQLILPADWEDQKQIYLVWITLGEVTDLRCTATSRAGAEFAQAILRRDHPGAFVMIEERITNHIYAHRCIEAVARWRSLRAEGD